MLSITFNDVSHPSVPVQRGRDLELGVEAHLRIVDAGGGIFEAPLFSIVELRSSIRKWLMSGADTDFNFVSVEADEDPLIYFRSIQNRWEIGSPWSERSGHSTREELIAASNAFVTDVDAWVLGHLGIADVDAFLQV